MAEIKIEKKKPVWPWILLILVILAAIAYFVYANNEAGDSMDDMNTTEIDSMEYDANTNSTTYEDTMDSTASTSSSMQYGESIKDSTRIGTDSTYTKSAFQNLSKAVTEKAAQYNLESSKSLEDLKNYASQMNSMGNSKMPNVGGISKDFKMVSTDIVTILENIQTKKFPTLQKEVADLKQTSNKLTSVAVEKQQTTLQMFFRKANDVLNKMNL
ncbi:MAG: hypothetical protein ABIO60_01990 [Aquaticitalea sp.]